MPAEKRCSKCGQNKLLASFARQEAAPDGRQAWCPKCTSDYQNERLAADPGYRRKRADDKRDYRATDLGKLAGARRKIKLATKPETIAKWRAVVAEINGRIAAARVWNFND